MVRFRNGAPVQRVISNAESQDQETSFQDQETSDAMQPWLTVSTARRTRTQVAFWPAGMTGIGRCPSPLLREWLRFPGCASSQPMKLVRLMTVKAARGRHLAGDPAGPAAVSRWTRRTGIPYRMTERSPPG
jgi:hypothetical protein